MNQVREILKEIQRRYEAGVPFSPTYHGGPRHIGPYLQKQAGLSKHQAEMLLRDWLNNGVVAIAVTNTKTKMRGLKVVDWL